MQDYEKDDDFAEIVHVGNVPFLYLPGDEGGRLVPASQIKSIIPDFKGTGSMLFFVDNERAVKLYQRPKEIVNDLLNPPIEEAE